MPLLVPLTTLQWHRFCHPPKKSPILSLKLPFRDTVWETFGICLHFCLSNYPSEIQFGRLLAFVSISVSKSTCPGYSFGYKKGELPHRSVLLLFSSPKALANDFLLIMLILPQTKLKVIISYTCLQVTRAFREIEEETHKIFKKRTRKFAFMGIRDFCFHV